MSRGDLYITEVFPEHLDNRRLIVNLTMSFGILNLKSIRPTLNCFGFFWLVNLEDAFRSYIPSCVSQLVELKFSP